MDLVCVCVREEKAVYSLYIDRAMVCCQGCHVSCSSLGDADEYHVLVAVVFWDFCVDLGGGDVGVEKLANRAFGHVSSDSS